MTRFQLLAVGCASGWDAFVQSHPKGTLFHTAAMCRTLALTQGYVPWARAAVDSAGAIRAILVAACVSTVQPLGKLAARSVLFAEPICTDDAVGCEALVALVDAHDTYMSRRALFAEVRPLFVSGREQVALMRCGYERLGYKNYVLDLAVPEEQLWKQVDRRCRGDIRRAKRRGVVIRQGCLAADLDLFYWHLRHSFCHCGIPLVSKSLFVSAFRELPAGSVELRIAEYRGEPVASACNLLFGNRIDYWYAGVVRIPGIAANSCLVWDSIRRAAASGLRTFDFGGAGWQGETYGPGNFKARFGGSLVDYGRYRRVYAARSLQIAEATYSFIRGFLAPPCAPNPSRRSPEHQPAIK